MRRATAGRIAPGFTRRVTADVAICITTALARRATGRIAEITEVAHVTGRTGWRTGTIARRAFTRRGTTLATCIGARTTGARFAAQRGVDCTFPIGSSRTS